MPRLSVWFLRASLVYLLIGFAIGGLLLAEKGIDYDPAIWMLLPIHMEFLLIGWLMQFALGMAFWILPRFGVGPPRGRENLILASLIMLNTGILLSALQTWLLPAALAGRLLETGAIIFYVVGSWSRVKPLTV